MFDFVVGLINATILLENVLFRSRECEDVMQAKSVLQILR